MDSLPIKMFVHKLRACLPQLTQAFLRETCETVEFIRKRKSILAELQYCKDHGNLIGIYSSVLGNGMFLLGVEDIITLGENDVIVFHNYDLSGIRLARRTIFISEISMVVPFNNPYSPPISQSLHESETMIV